MSIQSSNDPKAFNDFELQGWQANIAGYERHFAQLTRQTIPATLDAARVRSGSRVLDVCTGPGMLAEEALKRGAEAVGLDFSSEAIELATRNVPRAEFHQGDAQALPFDDDSFDAVVCGYGVIHVPSPEKAMREMFRVLRQGGRAAVSVWATPTPANGFGILYGAFKAHGDLAVPLPHGPDYFQFGESETMMAALESTGFHDVTVKRIEQSWKMDDPLALIQAVLEGTVRARGLLVAQTDEARKAIEASVIEGMSRCSSDDGRYEVPMPAFLGSGLK